MHDKIGCEGMKKLSVILFIVASSVHGQVEDLTYCVPCEREYMENFDIKRACENITYSTGTPPIEALKGLSTPCVPYCHEHYSSKDLSDICLNSETAFATDVTSPEEHCSIYANEVFFKGSCQYLLTSSSCGEGEWLTLSNGTAGCVKQDCPFGQILFGESCVDGQDDSVCGPNQELISYHDGLASCGCTYGFTSDLRTGSCYKRRTQGPCPASWYIEELEGGYGGCIPSPCLDNRFLYHYGRCYQKTPSVENCPPENVRQVSATEVGCLNQSVHHSIFAVSPGRPLIPCPSGYRRAHDGDCKEIFTLRMRPRRRSSL